MQMAEIELGVHAGNAAAIEDYYARYMNMQLGISIMETVGSATKSLLFQ